MIYLLIYFIVGLLVSILGRIHDKETWPVYLYLLVIIAWPIPLIGLIMQKEI